MIVHMSIGHGARFVVIVYRVMADIWCGFPPHSLAVARSELMLGVNAQTYANQLADLFSRLRSAHSLSRASFGLMINLLTVVAAMTAVTAVFQQV